MCLFKVRTEEDIYPPSRTTVIRARSPSPRRRTSRRISRTEVIRESRPASSTHLQVVRAPSVHSHHHVASSSYASVPAPQYAQIPAPQPVPVFVAPPPPMPAPSHSGHVHLEEREPQHRQPGHHFVEVSPRSSVSSDSSSGPGRSEYVVHEREYRRERARERDYSPEPEPRYESFWFVDGAWCESVVGGGGGGYDVRYTRTRERSRSRSRGPGYGRGSRDYGGGYEDRGRDGGAYRERERVVYRH